MYVYIIYVYIYIHIIYIIYTVFILYIYITYKLIKHMYIGVKTIDFLWISPRKRLGISDDFRVKLKSVKDWFHGKGNQLDMGRRKATLP